MNPIEFLFRLILAGASIALLSYAWAEINLLAIGTWVATLGYAALPTLVMSIFLQSAALLLSCIAMTIAVAFTSLLLVKIAKVLKLFNLLLAIKEWILDPIIMHILNPILELFVAIFFPFFNFFSPIVRFFATIIFEIAKIIFNILKVVAKLFEYPAIAIGMALTVMLVAAFAPFILYGQTLLNYLDGFFADLNITDPKSQGFITSMSIVVPLVALSILFNPYIGLFLPWATLYGITLLMPKTVSDIISAPRSQKAKAVQEAEPAAPAPAPSPTTTVKERKQNKKPHVDYQSTAPPPYTENDAITYRHTFGSY